MMPFLLYPTYSNILVLGCKIVVTCSLTYTEDLQCVSHCAVYGLPTKDLVGLQT